jgi:hypothetical protein
MNYQFNPNRDPQTELMRFLAAAKQERLSELPGLLAAALGLSISAISANTALLTALAIIDLLFKMPTEFVDGIVLKMFTIYQVGFGLVEQDGNHRIDLETVYGKMRKAFGQYSPTFAAALSPEIVALAAQFTLQQWLEDGFPQDGRERMNLIQFSLMLALTHYSALPSRDAIIDDAQAFYNNLTPDQLNEISPNDLETIKRFIALRNEDEPINPSNED